MKFTKIGVLLFIVATATVSISGGIIGYSSEKSVLTDAQLSNLEAITHNENTGNIVNCYSEFERHLGYDVYDCGSCTIIRDYKGHGGVRQCRYSGN